MTLLTHFFSNSFSSSMQKEISLLFLSLFSSWNLNVLKYPFVLGNIKTNGFITLTKYPIKYLELTFVSANFEMTTSLFYKQFFFSAQLHCCLTFLKLSRVAYYI